MHIASLIRSGLAVLLFTAAAQAQVHVLTMSPTSGPFTGGTDVGATGNLLGRIELIQIGQESIAPSSANMSFLGFTTPPGNPDLGAICMDVDFYYSQGSNQVVAEEQQTFCYEPVITHTTPSVPSAGGNIEIEIAGYVAGSTTVRVNNQVVGISSSNGDMVTVAVPAQSGSSVSIEVETPGGTSEPATVLVGEPPDATALYPAYGPTTGGTSVGIGGSGFNADDIQVLVDDVAVPETDIVVNAEGTAIEVQMPVHAEGPVDVVVVTPIGSTVPLEFVYYPVPTLTSLTPAKGPLAGGQTLTLTGTNFIEGITRVFFNGLWGDGVDVTSPTTLTVVTPNSLSPKSVNVEVESGGGLTQALTYYFVAAPTVTDLDPESGPEAGGTQVTITGSDFADATGVMFGDTAGTDLSVHSSVITVKAPPGEGVVDVVVQHPGGNQSAGSFTYLAQAEVDDVEPREGPAAGGTVMTITGSGFTGASAVTFDGDAGTAFSVESDTTIKVTTPLGSGVATIVVQGRNNDASAGQFTYIEPGIDSFLPSSGQRSGGTAVTLEGTGFTGATGVSFGGNAGTDFVVLSDTEIMVNSPEYLDDDNWADVWVEHPDGDIYGTQKFFYAPRYDSKDRDTGPETGNGTIILFGSGLGDVTGVTFGGVAGTGLSTHRTQLVVTPPNGTGTVPVVIQYEYGTVDAGDFTYLPAAIVDSFGPQDGPAEGGTIVTIDGSGFEAVTGVSFGANAGTNFSVVSDTEIKVTTPAGSGSVSVTLKDINGDQYVGDFTYLVPVTVYSMTPEHGPQAGGTDITINGLGLTGATGVTFDGVDGENFTVVSDQVITVTSPPGEGGVVVMVKHPDGDVNAGGFSYDAPAAVPVVGSIDPASGPLAGNSMVVIQGNGFGGLVEVTFGGIAAQVMSSDSTSAIVVTPAATNAGVVDVLVTAAGGTSAISNLAKYTYQGDTALLQDSIDVEEVANRLTMGVAQRSGAAMTSSISKGIAQGFGINPFDYSVTMDSAYFGYTDTQMPSDEAFNAVLAEQSDGQVSMWLDTRASGVLQALAEDNEGWQINVTGGIGYRVTKDLLIGVLAGYERFDYVNGNPQGRLSGSGVSGGVYAGARWGEMVADVAVAYTGLGYEAEAGAASGEFDAARWLVTGGLSGMFELGELTVRPSARVDAQWENQQAWTDSLSGTHAERQFGTARLSLGGTVSQQLSVADGLVLAPYLGLFGDIQTSWDSAASVSGSTSGRVTGGVDVTMDGGARISAGGEIGGLGSPVPMWSLNGGVAGQF